METRISNLLIGLSIPIAVFLLLTVYWIIRYCRRYRKPIRHQQASDRREHVVKTATPEYSVPSLFSKSDNDRFKSRSQHGQGHDNFAFKERYIIGRAKTQTKDEISGPQEDVEAGPSSRETALAAFTKPPFRSKQRAMNIHSVTAELHKEPRLSDRGSTYISSSVSTSSGSTKKYVLPVTQATTYKNLEGHRKRENKDIEGKETVTDALNSGGNISEDFHKEKVDTEDTGQASSKRPVAIQRDSVRATERVTYSRLLRESSRDETAKKYVRPEKEYITLSGDHEKEKTTDFKATGVHERPTAKKEVESNVSMTTKISPENISKRIKETVKYSLLCGTENADIYGKLLSLGQIIMTSQHFFEHLGNNNLELFVENLQILNAKMKTPSGNIFTRDWKECIPTSILCNDDASEVWCQKKGIYAHRMVGSEGGVLTVSGVSLEIFPGALEKETLITIGIVLDENFAPSLTKKQTFLSPIILCQPCNLKFKVPAKLSFPHAAQNAFHDWTVTCLKREGQLLHTNNWEPVSDGDCQMKSIEDNQIIMYLNHFTLYTCVGESNPGHTASKRVHMVAFVGKLQRNKKFKPRIYCLNDYKTELKEVIDLVSYIDGGLTLTETSQLLVQDNNEDVTVSIGSLIPGWILQGDEREILPFEFIWQAFQPHCTFIMKPTDPSVTEIYCEVKAYQKDAQKAAKLKIGETMPPQIFTLSDLQEEGLSRGAKLVKKLVFLLDPDTTVAGNWRDMAEKMGCDQTRIRWLGSQRIGSPTQFLLEKWKEENRTYEELKTIMLEINRDDAAEEIRIYIEEERERADNTRENNSGRL